MAGFTTGRELLGGGGPWYYSAAEYDFAEGCIIMSLVCIALIWEVAIHQVHHLIEHYAGGYGVKAGYEVGAVDPAENADEHEDEHADPHSQHGKPAGAITPVGGNALFTSLFERYIAETMVLGCLAFTVWCHSKNDGWNRICGLLSSASGINGGALLHMVEDVHMQLFIAMLFCFVGMAWTTHVAMKYQMKHLDAHRQRIKLEQEGGDHASAVLLDVNTDQSFFDRYMLHRDFFIRVTHKQVGEAMNADFDFSRYVACSTDVILADLTEFSMWTWFFVFCVTAVQTLLVGLMMPNAGSPAASVVANSTASDAAASNSTASNFTRRGGGGGGGSYYAAGASNMVWETLLQGIVLMCLTLGLYIWCFTGESWLDKEAQRCKDESEGKAAHEDEKDYTSEFAKSNMNDALPMRWMQAVSFSTALTLAKTIAGPRAYDGTWGGIAGNGLDGAEWFILYFGLMGLFIFQTLMQAQIVCDCSKILAFPPFFDDRNEDLARQCATVYNDAVDISFDTAAFALGLPKAMLKEKLMADFDACHTDTSKAGPPTAGGKTMEVEIE